MFLSDVFPTVIRFSAAFFTVIRLNSIMTLASNQEGAILYSKKLQINFKYVSPVTSYGKNYSGFW